MTAKDYKLCVSHLFGTVYISKVSKKNPGVMTNDRVIVPKEEFIAALIGWCDAEMTEDGYMNITEDGKVVLEITKPKEK